MNTSQAKNKPVSYRLPKKVKLLITILSEKLMISKTDIVTLAIIDMSKKYNAEINKEDEE